MCLVSLISTEEGFILSSNRDESPKRATHSLELIEKFEQTIYFPKDPAKGGSWIACSNAGRSAVILNGAFEKHKHLPPYKTSRGIMLLDSFEYSIKEFIKQYDFNGIEPFTLILAEVKIRICIVWDGSKLHTSDISTSKFNVWSSSPLYDKDMREERASWFKTALNREETINQDKLINVHKNGGPKNLKHSFRINWENKVATISFSSIELKNNSFIFYHEELLNEYNWKKEINITS